jgi:transcriptional regulator with XRE-family HTH domain
LDQEIGRLIRDIREAQGLSIASLARQVAFSQSHLRSVENGNRAATADLASACDKVLGTGGLLTDLLTATEGRDDKGRRAALGVLGIFPDPEGAGEATGSFASAWTVAGTLASAREVSEVSAVERRSFILLTSAAVSVSAHDWLIARPVGDVSSSAGRRITPSLVDDLDVMTGKLREIDDQIGGGSLVSIVSAQAGYVAGLLRDYRYSDSVGRRLHGTLGELLRLGGWVSFDVGRQAQAQRFWLAALHAAHTAGDRALGANVLGFMSEQAGYLGKLDDAARLAESALAGYGGGSPRVSAILHMRAARPRAMMGDDYGCRSHIDLAYDALRNSSPDSGEPDWSYWMVEEDLDAQAGDCFLCLNDYSSASSRLETSLRAEGRWQGSYARDGVATLVLLATAQARADEPEQACATGARAIDILSGQVDSPRLAAKIQRLRDDLAPYGHLSAVHEFREQADGLSDAALAPKG